MSDSGPEELIEIVDGGDVRLVVGDEPRPTRIVIRGKSRVELTGRLDRLTVEVLGAHLDASGLAVDELTVLLEQSQIVATAARSVAGWAVYGSTITVGGDAEIDELKTANAGRVVRAD